MEIPLSIWDLGLLFGMISIILLITLETVLSFYKAGGIVLDRVRLEGITYVFTMLFLAVVAIRIILVVSA